MKFVIFIIKEFISFKYTHTHTQVLYFEWIRIIGFEWNKKVVQRIKFERGE